ncbi:MAG: M3 family metallopeptidase [Acidobacteria bacterium]|nr:M3 family metallopeptidase [Acidobacteriota bacterium]
MNSCKLILLFLALSTGIPPVSSAQVGVAVQDNPFLTPYGTPFGTPPLDRIRNEHFLPAIQEGIRRHQAEIDAIVNNPAAATFANSLEALDAGGLLLGEVMAVFGALQGAHTNPGIQGLAKEVAPLMTAHSDNIRLNGKLFARVKALYDRREGLQLSPEARFLLETTYLDFVRGGALLDETQKSRLRELNRELAVLSLRFGDNLLAETNDFKLVIETKDDLAGLPPSVVSMAEATARQFDMPGKWAFTVQVPSMTPFLQYSTRRDLREKLHRAYFMRGDRDNNHDNKAIVRQIVDLRSERAGLLGYRSHADFVLEMNMARTPAAVDQFLQRLWVPSLERSKKETAEMQAIIDREGGGFKLASWDWWHYAEKLRQEKYALDDSSLRPYFRLENVREGIFTLCEKLYDLRFVPRKDIATYHPEVQVYEVREGGGGHAGILYMDFHPRPSKRGGAWSGAFRRQYYADGRRVAPLSTIVCNFTRPTADAPALLSVDEVKTFFHEFGHALATLLSDGKFRGRSVPRDGVELPSQIMENWALEPELLALYAKHYQTGAVIPDELVAKLRNSSLFNQGFESVEYLAASVLDMAWHTRTEAQPDLDVNQFEKRTMASIGLIPEIVPRYRSTYFNHIFSGGYSAGYYVYIWAELLDADAYEAFREKGLFDKATAQSFRRNVLEKYGALDLMTQYKAFRGAEPTLEPLLKRRGLTAQP